MVYSEETRNSASFRDPAATVFEYGGNIFRVINPCYFNEYDYFRSHVYPELIEKGLIIPHSLFERNNNRLIIEPDNVPFISYPYEWSFAMLKEAALTTLRINHIAMKHGMMLKDASAYNIQYYNGRMVLIDTTSFMFCDNDTPWLSYPQFLRHFVDPLLWIKYSNPYMRRLSEIYLDGIPVPLTNRMLPIISRIIDTGTITHIFTQAMAGVLSLDSNRRKITMRQKQNQSLLSSLYRFVKRLYYKPTSSKKNWTNYANAGSYTQNGLIHKKQIVSSYLSPGGTVLDLGSNTGTHSHTAAFLNSTVISIDSDHDCIFHLYDTPKILPLIVDICNPSPGIGWNNKERLPFWDRVGKVNTIMALALIHHLSIGNNVPLNMVADLLADHCNELIIEWVPLEDKQAQKLLNTKNIPEYSHRAFLESFNRRFCTIRKCQIEDSVRIIYKMQVRR